MHLEISRNFTVFFGGSGSQKSDCAQLVLSVYREYKYLFLLLARVRCNSRTLYSSEFCS